MKAKELDETFDRGDDITPYLDLSTAVRPGHSQKRANVDFGENMNTREALLTLGEADCA
jgi:hypothetical protein